MSSSRILDKLKSALQTRDMIVFTEYFKNPSDLSKDDLKSLIDTAIQTDNLEAISILIDNLAYDTTEPLSFLAGYYANSDEMLKNIYLLILDKYKSHGWGDALLYKVIATKSAKHIIETDFQVTHEEIMQLLNAYYEKQLLVNLTLVHYEKSLILEFSKHALIQVMGIIAPRIGKASALPLFIELSKASKFCYRPLGINGSVDIKLQFEAGFILFNQMPDIRVNSLYDETLNEIQRTFICTTHFESFFRDLNLQLTANLSHLPSLDKRCIKNQIKLYEMGFPNSKGFEWWKNLPHEQKSLHRAMHSLLLKSENMAGINLPLDNKTEGVPRFLGFIPNVNANDIITQEKRIFKESSNSLPGIIHGVDSHRIQLMALRYFIDKGIIRLPPGKTTHDLLTFIVDNDLWSDLFDKVGAYFSSPHYLMAYLRNANHLEALQKYAVFNFFNAINKFMLTDYSYLNYEELILIQSCADNNFVGLALDKLYIDWLDKSGHIVSFQKQDGMSWSACYFKKNKHKEKRVFFHLLEVSEQRNPQFTGRQKELKTIADGFANHKTIQILTGMGGIGKSSLVKEFIHRNLTKYTIIWELDAANLNQSFDRLFYRIKKDYPEVIEELSLTVKQPQQMFREALQSIPNWLLVFDNAESEQAIKEYLPKQNAKYCQRILVTSRNQQWPSYINNVINLGCFTDEEAMSYLRIFLPNKNVEDLQQINNLFSNFPLGIVQAMGYIRQTGVEIDEYIDFFTTKRTELWSAEDKPHSYQHTLLTVWNRDIEQCSVDAIAKTILYCCGLINSTTISLNIFSKLDNESVKNAVKLLVQHSLLEYDEALNQISLHPLLQLIIKDRIAESAESLKLIQTALTFAGDQCDIEFIKKIAKKNIEEWLVVLEQINSNEPILNKPPSFF